MYRKVADPGYVCETIPTPDNDFLDIDWLRRDHDRLVIISHGLEGNSHRHYMRGMATHFHKAGWDVLAWNCRSCSGRMNVAPRLYHHAASDDLETVIRHATKHTSYKRIGLVGFSMGGSMSLKYLGEKGKEAVDLIAGCVVFSVPCDLGASSRALDRFFNAFYRKRFLKKLKYKVQLKANQYPGLVNLDGIEVIDSFTEFDNRYTAPFHGFKDADDFYRQGSANHYLKEIHVPTLIVNAKNDPMLPESCYPVETVRDLPSVFLEVPNRGGHAGFTLSGRDENWMEVRALEFLNACS